ncbi:AraC family transcriptional regulator [Aestuariirhabdus litorea]|uniref:AraC family transcriptional regulator n=1 Tax=Aestuariirhabdus litorea TaxID=2528527 RepID=A0A3P3VPU7_9GAMM|nr:AraC family transcriptional regulator [Aestuariirhabdus litorea]RRJ84640.1 AraC family transcriptional regulator [Aestuariirhabdus litorea]RWW97865.1 helix-turn-helix domain-containing protein [Endozoicomonadaceae bacterium GTF-13]
MDRLGRASIAALHQYLREAELRRIDTSSLLSNLGISPQLLGDSSQQIDGQAFQQLLKSLITRSRDPLFGLHCARHVQPGSYSVLGYISMNCDTLGSALKRIVPYEKLIGDMGTSSIEYYNDHTVLHWSCHYDDPEVVSHMVDNHLASWLAYGRWITDGEGSPLKVSLMRPQPEPAVKDEYRSAFGCPVYFGQSMNALFLKNDYLKLPLRQSNRQLLQTLEEHARALITEQNTEQSLALRVRYALKQKIRDGVPRKDLVADKLAMTPRTMQRKLRQENTSYQQILDRLRQESAEHFLLETAMPITGIALRLGFSEPRSFHRSFKQWFGITPGEYRARNAIPGPDGSSHRHPESAS